MPTYTVTGKDTLTLFGRVINDLASDDVTAITFPEDLAAMKTGKNRNSIYAKNEAGNNATMVLRMVRGSSDDKFLQSKIVSQEKDFAAFALAEGEFVKRVGDGEGGEVLRDVYTLQGGYFTRKVDVKENTSGDTEQAISVYNMMFAVAERGMQ